MAEEFPGIVDEVINPYKTDAIVYGKIHSINSRHNDFQGQKIYSAVVLPSDGTGTPETVGRLPKPSTCP